MLWTPTIVIHGRTKLPRPDTQDLPQPMPTTTKKDPEKNTMKTYKFETPISLAYPCFFNYELDVEVVVGFRDRARKISIPDIPIVRDGRMILVVVIRSEVMSSEVG